ncbi:putative short chain oxidoreductase/dehydrogenase [Hypoxylon cercidicola]|nr:putative short chain oxidoreductase/dehydrogenase [Hypoxylon cercidicola]
MAEAKPQVWLVTGASRGLGLNIARAALKVGHKVIACYRNRSKNPSTFTEVEALGGVWLQLDVVGENVESQVQSVIAQYGQIDVLVNNAGYPILGSIEHTSVDLIDGIFKTNFVGTIRTIQAALPSMRSRRSGTIVNIGSATAINPTPGLGLYSATKSAVEGVTEALQAEVASFNIRVLVVHPGMMATDILDPQGTGIQLPLDDAYKGTPVELTYSGLFNTKYLSMAADPANVAQRIVELVDNTGIMAGRALGPRVYLGREAGAYVEERAAQYAGLVKDMKDVWESV